MNCHSGKVLSNNRITGDYYHLVLYCPDIAKEVKEGQIIHVRCGKSSDTLLRRPFSIYRFNKDTGNVELMYIVKGKGTLWMSQLTQGDRVDLLGPVGNHYKTGENVQGICVIGRGVGIASIVSLAEKGRTEKLHVTAILSAKSEELIISKEFLREIGCNVICVNDQDKTSSVVHVEQILNNELSQYPIQELFCCGSNRIGKMIRKISREHEIKAFISLEEHMACGIGICQGCVCETKEGYKTVCKDGPVFNIEEVVL